MLVHLINPRGVIRTTIVAESATTPAQITKGLAGRAQVRIGTGMLFTFPQDVELPFTVEKMVVPIDLIWIDGAGRVLGTAMNLRPGDTTPVQPPAAYRRVLETAVGTLRSLGLGVGWSVSTG